MRTLYFLSYVIIVLAKPNCAIEIGKEGNPGETEEILPYFILSDVASSLNASSGNSTDGNSLPYEYQNES